MPPDSLNKRLRRTGDFTLSISNYASLSMISLPDSLALHIVNYLYTVLYSGNMCMYIYQTYTYHTEIIAGANNRATHPLRLVLTNEPTQRRIGLNLVFFKHLDFEKSLHHQNNLELLNFGLRL